MRKRNGPPPTIDELRSRLDYNPETGGFTWKNSKYQPYRAGGPAGWIDSHGHLIIELRGHRLKGGRAAWAYVHGNWPLAEIDHKDRNPLNNRIANLRPATRSQNTANIVRTRKYDLPRGVCHNKRRFLARIRKDGVVMCLGTYDTPEQASDAYTHAALRLHGEFLPG
jgi:hypothetical protein